MAAFNVYNQKSLIPMVHSTNINDLLHAWQNKLQNNHLSSEYKDALNDCLYDLQEVLKYSWQEEFLDSLPSEEAEQYLLEQEADNYLSTIEAHENIA